MNKKTALIADDDPDYLFQTRVTLERMGFEVVSADSQQQAEQLLETLKPDLCIFDLMMENDDSGFILSYKTKKKYPDTPVIIATAVTKETGISFSLETEGDKNWIKADLYLEKGLRSEQLHREISKLMTI